MSALLTDEDLRTVRKPLKAPPKRWRNRWRVRYLPDVALITVDGRGVEDGYEFEGGATYPSKEIAEQRAIDDVSRMAARVRAAIEYLGAFPVQAP